MAEARKYWFSRRRGWRGGFPISWEGWAWLTCLFAAEVAVSRELLGAPRAVAFFVVLLGFWLLARGRTLTLDN